jgi:excisionase family DNA binding protein
MIPSEQAKLPKLLWNCREAAAALSISLRTLWTLTNEGRVPCVRIGRSVRYDPEDIRRWIQSQKTGTSLPGQSENNLDVPESSG